MFLRKRWQWQRTLYMKEEQLLLRISRGCPKKLQISCESARWFCFLYFNICKSRFESDGEESEEEEKILDKHEKPEPLSAFIHSTRYWLLVNLQKNMVNIFQFRKMFLLQYALEVKLGEKTRLETIIKVDFIKYQITTFRSLNV